MQMGSLDWVVEIDARSSDAHAHEYNLESSALGVQQGARVRVLRFLHSGHELRWRDWRAPCGRVLGLWGV